MFLLPWDLCSDGCAGKILHSPKFGVLDVNAGFKTAFANNMTLVLYCLFDAVLYVDQNRDVRVSVGGQ